MKRIVASVGLVAVGVSGAYASSLGLSGVDASKTWSVSATLRGFYDDNYLYLSRGERDSYGFEVSPSVRFNMPLEQTYLGLGYLYNGRYYADRDDSVFGRDNEPWAHSHQFDLIFNHAFSERYSVDLRDSFVIAQDPEVLAPQGTIPVVFRKEGDNMRNQARATFTAQMAPKLGLQLGYNNVWWDYEDDTATGAALTYQPSYSGRLDRLEHLGVANLRWQMQPETTVILGYNFGVVQYTGDEVIANPLQTGGITLHSEDRDNRSHYIYGGLTQSFLRNLTASLKLGGTYIDYDNEQVNQNTWIPFADISASFTYARGSYFQLGFVHSFNATDEYRFGNGTITGSQETSTIYGLLHHQITPKLAGNVHVHFQDSAFQGGLYDSQTDQYLVLGLNLTYQITRNFSCEAGYDFSKLDSDIPGRPYDRNRVYIGVTASY